jgi:hypothetical protein
MNEIIITRKEKHREGYKRFYIGRPSPLQNDNPIASYAGEGCGRMAAIREYKKDLRQKMINQDDAVMQEIYNMQLELLVGPIQLDCHCAPALCHGEVIKEYLETGKL